MEKLKEWNVCDLVAGKKKICKSSRGLEKNEQKLCPLCCKTNISTDNS